VTFKREFVNEFILYFYHQTIVAMTALEKNELKEAIREIIREDKHFIKDILRELIEEPTQEQPQTTRLLDRAEKVDAIIRRDFERYKHVFKALA
jgi:endonuclease III